MSKISQMQRRNHQSLMAWVQASSPGYSFHENSVKNLSNRRETVQHCVSFENLLGWF